MYQPPPISKELRDVLHAESRRVKSGTKNTALLRLDLQRLSDKGDPVAQFLFAMLFYKDEPRTKKQLLTQSALGGCAGAAGILGAELLSKGERKDGLMWIDYAAYEGDAAAQTLLADLYLKNEMDADDGKEHAYAWLRLAKRQTYSSTQRAVVFIQLVNLKAALSEEEISHAEIIYRRLEQKIGVMPEHPCGQSAPYGDAEVSNHLKLYSSIRGVTMD